MATHKEYLYFILDQLSEIDGITHRQMMGDTIIYHHGKIAAYLCDDRLLVKPVASAVKIMPAAKEKYGVAFIGYTVSYIPRLSLATSG